MAENRGPQVEGVAILFLFLTWSFVGLRCYVRAVMIKGFGMDDWLAVASLVRSSRCTVHMMFYPGWIIKLLILSKPMILRISSHSVPAFGFGPQN